MIMQPSPANFNLFDDHALIYCCIFKVVSHKRKNFSSIIVLAVILATSVFPGCHDYDIQGPYEAPLIELQDSIIHPPDTFIIVYPTKSSRYPRTGITFDTTGTWLIQKLNSQAAQLRIIDSSTDSTLYKMTTFSHHFRFEEGIHYEILAYNSHFPVEENLFVYFRHLE